MKYIYTINDDYAVFTGVSLESGEKLTRLIIPDFYLGLPVQSASLGVDTDWCANLEEIIIGNNVRTIISKASSAADCHFAHPSLKKIYIGKSVSLASALNSSKKLGENVTEIYYATDSNLSLPDTNRAGNKIKYYKGKLEIKYQLSLSTLDEYATKDYVDEKIGEITVSNNHPQSDFLENNEALASHILNRPFYDTRKFEDIDIVYTGDEVTAELIATSGFWNETYRYFKVCDLPDDYQTVAAEISKFTSDWGEEVSVDTRGITDNTEGNYASAQVFVRNGMVDIVIAGEPGVIIDTIAAKARFPEKGIYVIAGYTGAPTIKSIISKITFKSNIKKLDSKFLNIDTTPQQDSDNLITSGAVFKEFDEFLVTTEKFQDGAVTESKIFDGAVTAKKIADGEVTKAKLETSLKEEIEVGISTAQSTADEAKSTADSAKNDAKWVADEFKHFYDYTFDEWLTIGDEESKLNAMYIVDAALELEKMVDNKMDNITITPEDEGKFLMIQGGAVAMVAVPNVFEEVF